MKLYLLINAPPHFTTNKVFRSAGEMKISELNKFKFGDAGVLLIHHNIREF
jgi:hypothetical protein